MPTQFPFLKTILLLLITVSGFYASAQGDKAYIQLQSPQSTINPKEFYIAGIADERNDNTSIGKMMPVAIAGKAVAPVNVDLAGGFQAIKTYIGNALQVNKALHPVVIKLNTLNITETPAANGRVEGSVKLSIRFGLLRDNEFIHLDDYTATSTYQHNAGSAQQIEPLLRSVFNNSLLYINGWMDNQADNNIKLAKGVKVFFTDHKEELEGDTVYYDVNRPLKWTDFREKPQYGSKHGAEIFASLGYTEDVKLIKGIINITLNIKVYMPKSASWVQLETYGGLVHEQRHFDIVKLGAEHFKQRIKAERLNVYNYDGPINVAYLDALREIYEMQKQYDRETGHSINAYQQRQWNYKIDKELQQLGVKPLTDQAAAN